MASLMDWVRFLGTVSTLISGLYRKLLLNGSWMGIPDHSTVTYFNAILSVLWLLCSKHKPQNGWDCDRHPALINCTQTKQRIVFFADYK